MSFDSDSHIYFALCAHCMQNLIEKDPILAGIYRSICETYLLGYPSVLTTHGMRRGIITKKDVAFLEKKGYIVTTEKNLSDIYLKPLGYESHGDTHTFCIKRAIHKTN